MTDRRFSLDPDPHMAWIYNPSHPDYHDKGKDLRDRRAAALRACPAWMIQEAVLNDALREEKKAWPVPRVEVVMP